PLIDYKTIVNLIAKTTTEKGLKVKCRLDRQKYSTGRKISDEEMKRINIVRNTFHGEWNYVIKPNTHRST
ncbi:MAG: ISAzo13 family transposase, partial [Ilumatobacteraceae bacterium]|nr:ISAzo13 family transposase [Ilumatobacteraceae bacterium]